MFAFSYNTHLTVVPSEVKCLGFHPSGTQRTLLGTQGLKEAPLHKDFEVPMLSLARTQSNKNSIQAL